jgi:signal transduction histidine kinase
LLAHAQHSRSNVREAVAEAALHFPDAAFEQAMSVLLADRHQFVKKAAAQTYDERSRRARVVREQQEQSQGMRELRAWIEDEYDARVLRAADRLKELALSQFVERLEHEIHKLSTPLDAAITHLCTQARTHGGDPARLATRAEEVHALVKLAFDVVESARVHAEVTAPSFAEVAASEIVDEQLGLLRARVGEARVARLRVEKDVDPLVTLDADRTLLALAVSNVLQNAVEAYAVGGGGEIWLRVAVEQPQGGILVAIVVEDRGGGIDASTLKSIGEPFVSSKGRGRGLGVLNVKKMVEGVHGGSVEIESERGRGTRVKLVRPRRQAEGGGKKKSRRRARG